MTRRTIDPDDAARRRVLINYRRARRHYTPAAAIAEEVAGFARALGAHVIKTGEVDGYYARHYAAAVDYHELIWAKWRTREHPNYWRTGKLVGPTA